MAKVKKLFTTKDIGKRLGPAVGQSTAGTAGFLAGKIITNKIVSKKPEAAKIIGPASFLAGTAIIAVTDDKHPAAKYVHAGAIGLSASGGFQMVDTLVDDTTKQRIGLSGVPSDKNGSNQEEQPDVFDELAQEAENEVEQELSGMEEPEDEPVEEPGNEEEPGEQLPVSGIENTDTSALIDELMD